MAPAPMSRRILRCISPLFALAWVASLAAPARATPLTPALRLDYTAANNPYCIAVGDLNGDGVTDVVEGNYGINSISVFPGTAKLGFASKTDYAVAGNPSDVVLADLNGDGRLDMIVSCFNVNLLSVRMGDGAGASRPSRSARSSSLAIHMPSIGFSGRLRRIRKVARMEPE